MRLSVGSFFSIFKDTSQACKVTLITRAWHILLKKRAIMLCSYAQRFIQLCFKTTIIMLAWNVIMLIKIQPLTHHVTILPSGYQGFLCCQPPFEIVLCSQPLQGLEAGYMRLSVEKFSILKDTSQACQVTLIRCVTHSFSPKLNTQFIWFLYSTYLYCSHEDHTHFMSKLDSPELESLCFQG